jgi:hypothetical protein
VDGIGVWGENTCGVGAMRWGVARVYEPEWCGGGGGWCSSGGMGRREGGSWMVLVVVMHWGGGGGGLIEGGGGGTHVRGGGVVCGMGAARADTSGMVVVRVRRGGDMVA